MKEGEFIDSFDNQALRLKIVLFLNYSYNKELLILLQ